jgi:DnaJ-class molecular chaperone
MAKPDFFDSLFNSAMQRITEHVDDFVDDLLDSLEAEIDHVVLEAERGTTKKRKLFGRATPEPPPKSRKSRTTGPVSTVTRQRPLPTHYDQLEVHPHASRETIEAAYKSLAKRFHPDINQDKSPAAQERMRLINAAWTVLNDPKKRKEYDKSIL